jgi:DNA mismatch endonuclease, patch repair protein
MTDVFDKATRSRIMSGVRTAHTAPEILLGEKLHAARLRPRRQATELPGSPDLVLDHVRVAVFVDGDFWHGRAWFEARIAPRQNRGFWIAKFEKKTATAARTPSFVRAGGPFYASGRQILRMIPLLSSPPCSNAQGGETDNVVAVCEYAGATWARRCGGSLTRPS